MSKVIKIPFITLNDLKSDFFKSLNLWHFRVTPTSSVWRILINKILQIGFKYYQKGMVEISIRGLFVRYLSLNWARKLKIWPENCFPQMNKIGKKNFGKKNFWKFFSKNFLEKFFEFFFFIFFQKFARMNKIGKKIFFEKFFDSFFFQKTFLESLC